jgi:hypothetical protein
VTGPSSQRDDCHAKLTPVELLIAHNQDPESGAEVRAWARAHGLTVPARGKLRPKVWGTWRAAHL